MAGRHASSAPLLLTRAVVTLASAAVLLAIGVLAITVLFGGDGTPAPRAGSAADAPGAPRETPPSETAPAESGADEPTVFPTTGRAVVPTVVPASERPRTTRAASGRAAGPGPVGTASLLQPVPVGSATSLPGVGPVLPALGPPWSSLPTPTGVGPGAGWWNRSDLGREHGRAVGLLSTPGRACPPAAVGRPAAQPDRCR